MKAGLYKSSINDKDDLLRCFDELEVKLDHSREADEKTIFRFLKKQDVCLILQAAEHSQNLVARCESQQMDEYWQQLWKLSGECPSWSEAANDRSLVYRPLLPQPKLSSFQLVRGWYFFRQANDLVDKGIEESSIPVLEQLYKAASYHNFAALKELTYLGLQKGTLEELKTLAFLLESSARFHGTPVYLLCGQIYLGMARLYQCEDFFSLVHEHTAYQIALKYLYAAEAAQSESEAAIYNAYYGLGLAKSNQWGIKSIAALREFLIESTSLRDDKIAQNLAKKTGEALIAESLLNHHDEHANVPRYSF